MISYKLTDQDGYTRRGLSGESRWEIGATVVPPGAGEGRAPCGPGVLHAYAHPLLAALMNPIHANIPNPRMFLVEHEVPMETDGLKCWTTEPLTIVAEKPLPEITTAQRAHWAILVSLEVPQPEGYRAWAEGWLSGADRSAEAAMAARAAAAEAAWAAAWAEAAWAEAARAEAWAEASWAAARAAAAWAEVEATAPLEFQKRFQKRLIELAEQAIREEGDDA